MSAVKHSQAMFFQARAGEKVRDSVLQRALQKAKPLFVGKRAKGMAALADDGLDFEGLRTACEDIRNRVLSDLDVWLAIFEAIQMLENGISVGISFLTLSNSDLQEW